MQGLAREYTVLAVLAALKKVKAQVAQSVTVKTFLYLTIATTVHDSAALTNPEELNLFQQTPESLGQEIIMKYISKDTATQDPGWH